MIHLGRTRAASLIAAIAIGLALVAPAGIAAAGPPFPDPVPGQAVYDTAGILSPAAIAQAEATIDTIEERTGAEIVVYSQLVDYGVYHQRDGGHARSP